MAKYRKKSVVIEAVQLRAGEQDGVLAKYVVEGKLLYLEDGDALIDTPDGELRANVRDWIVIGDVGELYVYKPSVFEAKYEPADERELDRLEFELEVTKDYLELRLV